MARARRDRVLTMIMAGGEGGRLDLLTRQRAKPALPFAGVYRLIDFPLSNCAHSGLSDVWVVAQYQPHSLSDHLANGRPWDLDRNRGGLRLLPPFATREENDEGGFAEGNADALYRNRELIRGFGASVVLVLSADHIYKLDYRDVLDRHRERGADVTMVTTRVPLEEVGRFGTVRPDEEGRVLEFEYKPERPRWDVVTAEVFVYDARVLLDTLETLAAEGRRDDENEAPLKDYGDALLPRLVEAGRAFEYRFDGYWRDVGVIGSYWRGHMDLLAPEPGLQLDDPRWPILSHQLHYPPARIRASARIDDSLISPGCDIHGLVERSVLAPGCVVEEGATVRDAILLHRTTVCAGATVNCAIVDYGVEIGAGATVGQPRDGAVDDEDIALVGRLVRVGPGAVIPAGAHEERGETASDGEQ